MSAAKHTPGPWVRGDPESFDSLATIETADGASVLAEVFYREGCGTLEQAEADLALMLAAPALADALEAALIFVPRRTDEFREAQAALRAAGRLP